MLPLFLACSLALPTLAAPPTAGMVVTKSERFPVGRYLLKDSHEDGTGAAILIQGDNLTVDFGGATIQGTPETTEPDQRAGTGILVRGKNVTLKNVHVRGYRIGLMATSCAGLKILDSDFSYNWKQHLASTQEREDLSDWMSFHQNEKDEWLRYGAGVYLKNCEKFEVRHCRITGGQCGLMLTGSNHGLVWNNDFSFLSGIGVGLYRSSENHIQHNKIDWCVRGYSHGVYNRGQDSAGILIYEQSDRNVFAYNSVTHGGDGFFLWAGQTTMDTGQGGCNDNIVFGNDFSHAPTNGIEATFSRNTFAHNKVMECWHGVWGGYSFDTAILGNIFGYNAESIAIEHGQHNRIERNTFLLDNAGIHLWANDSQDPNWGYPKHHDTVSHDYRITNNIFDSVFTAALTLRKTRDILFENNRLIDTPAVREQTEVAGLTQQYNKVEKGRRAQPARPTMQPSGNPDLATEIDENAYRRRFAVTWNPTSPAEPAVAALAPKPLAGAIDPFLKPTALRGRRYILVDHWGPYDFRRPVLWPRQKDKTTIAFDILGPKGTWRVKSLSPGVRLIDGKTEGVVTGGTVPDRVTASLPESSGKAQYIKVELEYIGGETTDYKGIVTPAGKPVAFGYSEFFAPLAWNIRFYTWEKGTSDPRTAPEAFAARLKMEPLKTLTTDRLDFAGYGRFSEGVPADYFATIADGTVEVEPGDYILEVTTDDGCRVSVDGKPVITDAWKYQGPTLYSAPLKLGGKHTIHVEHFQIDGYATLRVNLRPANTK